MMDDDTPGLFLQMIDLTAKYQQLVMRWDTSISDAGEWLGYYLSVKDGMFQRQEALPGYLNLLEDYREKWLAWEKEAVALLNTFMPKAEALETVCTKSKIYIFRCDDLIQRLGNWSDRAEEATR
jgi:hypothetical protein